MICVSRTQEKLQSQTALKKGTTAESQTCKQTVAVLLNTQKVERTTDVAACLMARDYKGLGKMQLGNGVLEWKE